LSGKIQAYVRGCIRLPIGKRCAKKRITLFSWNGISWSNRELGNWSRTVTVGCR